MYGYAIRQKKCCGKQDMMCLSPNNPYKYCFPACSFPFPHFGLIKRCHVMCSTCSLSGVLLRGRFFQPIQWKRMSSLSNRVELYTAKCVSFVSADALLAWKLPYVKYLHNNKVTLLCHFKPFLPNISEIGAQSHLLLSSLFRLCFKTGGVIHNHTQTVHFITLCLFQPYYAPISYELVLWNILDSLYT